jgi:hypothetical protein
MNIGRNTVLSGVILAGVLIILSRLVHWPLWTVLVGIAAIAGGAWVFMTATQRHQLIREGATPPLAVAPDPPPREYQKETVTGIRLPSGRADYHFVFSAMVLWLPVGAASEWTPGLKDLAVHEIVRRAGDLTQAQDPGGSWLIGHELSRALSEPRSDAKGRIQAMAESVQLLIPDEDQHRLDKLAAIRKDEDVWEHERQRERSMRRYLGTDVLKDPGSAVVWWLARNDDQLDKAVQNISLLGQLSRAANNAGIFEPTEPRVAEQPATSAADLFDAFMVALGITRDSDDHVLFTDQVANLVAKRGYQEVADEMTGRGHPPDAVDEDASSGLLDDEPPAESH